jgi:hypothetical protein
MIKKRRFSIRDLNNEKKLLNKSINQKISHKKELYQLSSNITWAPKISCLNFLHIDLFNSINRPNQFEVTYNFNFSKIKEKKKFIGSPENSQFFETFQHNIK